MNFTTNLKEKPLPPGTKVVTQSDKPVGEGRVKRGSVGVVEKVDSAMVTVKFPDGKRLCYARPDLVPQRDTFRVEHLEVGLDYESVKSLIVFEFITGSTAYGLNTPESDEDVTGAYVLPTKLTMGLKKYRDSIQRHDPDGAFHEIAKLIALAGKGNPNVIELGEISRMPELIKVPPQDETVQELFDRWEELFLSKYVFRAYQGYAISQFKKIEQDLRNKGEIRWKHACHLMRLLWSGAECLRTNKIIVRPSEPTRSRLMSLRFGKLEEKAFREWRLELEKEFQSAFDQSTLPEKANMEAANDLLIRIRTKFYEKLDPEALRLSS